MICQNQQCGYQFFEQEQHYVLCPRCGELVADNLPATKTMEYAIEIEQLHFKRFLEIWGYVTKVMIILVALSGILMIITSPPAINSSRFRSIRSILKYYSALIIIFAAVFMTGIDKVAFYRKIVGEVSYICNTLRYKLVKLLLLVVGVLLLYQYVFPFIYELTKFNYIKYGISLKLLDHFQFYSLIWFWIVLLYCVFTDFYELYRYHLCEKISSQSMMN